MQAVRHAPFARTEGAPKDRHHCPFGTFIPRRASAHVHWGTALTNLQLICDGESRLQAQ